MDGKIGYFGLLLISIVLGVGGQILLKLAATTTPGAFMQLFFSRYFFVAVGVYGLSLGLYTISLKQIPLQIAFPAVSFSYVAVSCASHWIWGTSFGMREIAALALITFGVFLLAWSN